jgi:hypothetical protein
LTLLIGQGFSPRTDTVALRKRKAERRELEVLHLQVLKALLSREQTREIQERQIEDYKNLSCSRGNKKKTKNNKRI